MCTYTTGKAVLEINQEHLGISLLSINTPSSELQQWLYCECDMKMPLFFQLFR